MGLNCKGMLMKKLWLFFGLIILSWGLVSCGDRTEIPNLSNYQNPSQTVLTGNLSEVAPPRVIRKLHQSLDSYNPQVSILSPKADEVFADTTVSVQLQVQDLPIFKDPELEIGPHLHLILDNESYVPIYDLDQPIIFEDLSPGTHTIRVFASRPWHESFKNEGAYDQITFHILTKTNSNNPDPSLPLLTYSRPQGTYGAQPIMLDFYLTNAPLHLVAQENQEDELNDWRIRVTANGESFVLDSWEPVYLKGFKRGKNWVQLEFIDEQGNNIDNVFNNTVSLITYEPNGGDTLSQLVRGKLSLAQARRIVDPNYTEEAIEPVEVEEETIIEEIPATEVEEVITEETTEPIEVEGEPIVEEIPAAEVEEVITEETTEPIEVEGEPIVEEIPAAEVEEVITEEITEPIEVEIEEIPVTEVEEVITEEITEPTEVEENPELIEAEETTEESSTTGENASNPTSELIEEETELTEIEEELTVEETPSAEVEEKITEEVTQTPGVEENSELIEAEEIIEELSETELELFVNETASKKTQKLEKPKWLQGILNRFQQPENVPN